MSVLGLKKSLVMKNADIAACRESIFGKKTADFAAVCRYTHAC